MAARGERFAVANCAYGDGALRKSSSGPNGPLHGCSQNGFLHASSDVLCIDAESRTDASPSGESAETPLVCVLAGSPHRGGASEALAAHVARGVERAGCRADLLRLADFALAGCTGCGACERTGACVLDAPERRRAAAPDGRPGFPDLYARLDAADALALVAPVYFSGPPSQLKAVLDRMQPLWSQRYLLHSRPVVPLDARRPFDLFVVGSGGDPFGFDALVSCVRSALRMADFELRARHDCIGYRSARPVGDGLPPASDDAAFELRAEAAGADLARSLGAR